MRIVSVVITCVVLFNLLSFTCDGQSIRKEKIAGTWVCTKVSFLKDDALADSTTQEGLMIVTSTRDAFTHASFTFGADSVFRLKFPPQVKNPVTQELSALNGKKWHWDAKSKMVDISPRENLMSIAMREFNGVTFFLLYETPIVLVMSKVDP
ncbi:MAG: hypothetical protein QM762_13525 [Chryseolinea sp.]